MPTIGITATAQPTTGSVRLTISSTPSAAVVVARTDANGVGVVRQLAGQTPSSGALVLDDYEVALGGVASYTVSPAVADGSYTPGTATVNTDSLTGDWLGLPVFPALNVPLETVTGLTQDRQSKTTYHEIVNRKDDVANIQDLGVRNGSMEFRATNAAKARGLVSVLERSEYMLVRFYGGLGLDLYFLVDRVSIAIVADPYDTRRFAVTVDYREVKAPTDPRQGALGWTVADLSAYTVAQARARFGTVANMTAGTAA